MSNTPPSYDIPSIDEALGRARGRTGDSGPDRGPGSTRWDDRHEIVGGYFLRPPTTVHGSLGSFGPGSAPTYGGLQDPYRAGDMRRILQNQISQGGINDLQLSLMDAGLLDDKKITPGHLGPATVTAFENLLAVANQNGMPWQDVLSQAIQGGGTLGSPSAPLPPEIVHLPNREDILYTLEKTSMDMTGHKLDEDLLEGATDAHLNALRTQQERQFQQEISMGELNFTEDMPGERGQQRMLEEEIRDRAPQLVAERGAQNARDVWFEGLAGPVSNG